MAFATTARDGRSFINWRKNRPGRSRRVSPLEQHPRSIIKRDFDNLTVLGRFNRARGGGGGGGGVRRECPGKPLNISGNTTWPIDFRNAIRHGVKCSCPRLRAITIALNDVGTLKSRIIARYWKTTTLANITIFRTKRSGTELWTTPNANEMLW